MELTLDPAGAHHVVRFVHDDAIGVDARELTSSFLLAPTQVVDDWSPRSLDELAEAHLEAILSLSPEVVLLGTGATQAFAPMAVVGWFLSRGIGIEAMSNAAAGRTFNLLAGEGRRVVAAFLLPD